MICREPVPPFHPAVGKALRRPTLLVVAAVFLGACRAPTQSGDATAESTAAKTETEGVDAVEAVLPRVPDSDSAPALEAPGRFRLDNGLEVWWIPSEGVPLVTARLVIRAGSEVDPAGKEGLADLAFDLLDEGAGDRDSLALADEIEFLGAELSIETSKEWSAITLETLARNLEPSLAILGDIVIRPRLAPEDWERIQELAVNALRQRAEEPRAIASVVASRQWYEEGARYGHPDAGWLATVEALSLDDAQAFLSSWFQPRNAVLLVVGPVDRTELEPLTARTLGDWKDSSTVPDRPAASSARYGRGHARLVAVHRAGAPQTVVRVLAPALSRHAEGAAAQTLSSVILGGTFTSRLNANLREDKKITYGAFSTAVRRTGPSFQLAATDVEADSLSVALVEIFRELEMLSVVSAEELKEGEHAKAVSTQRARLISSLGTQGGIAELWEPIAGTSRDPSLLLDDVARALATTAEEIAAQAWTSFRWKDALIVLVGDRESIESELRELEDSKGLSLAGASGFSLPPVEWLGPEGE